MCGIIRVIIILEEAILREQIINTVREKKIIVIARGVEKEKLIPLTEALYEGGIRLLETTYSADGKISDDETAENIKMLSSHFDGRMYIGAGTVLTEKQIELTKNAGGKFIISPDTNGAVIKKTRELGMVSIPGALTPSEVQSAHLYGADFVKLFPVCSLGTEYVKLIKTPLSHIELLAVGGIQQNDMAEYLAAGVSGFCIGSNIIDKNALAKNNYKAITELAKEFVSIANS